MEQVKNEKLLAESFKFIDLKDYFISKQMEEMTKIEQFRFLLKKKGAKRILEVLETVLM